MAGQGSNLRPFFRRRELYQLSYHAYDQALRRRHAGHPNPKVGPRTGGI